MSYINKYLFFINKILRRVQCYLYSRFFGGGRGVSRPLKSPLRRRPLKTNLFIFARQQTKYNCIVIHNKYLLVRYYYVYTVLYCKVLQCTATGGVRVGVVENSVGR